MTSHDPGGKIRRKLNGDVVSRAVFGGVQGEYRYLLHRSWASPPGAVMFVMMNPSTADIEADDPTVAKCQRYARCWGHGSLYIVNTFAYRATDQKQLMKVTTSSSGYALEMPRFRASNKDLKRAFALDPTMGDI